MGGRDASRGFLYQAFASVLEALCEESWDKIYIEFESNEDKVDIALEKKEKIIKSIQVKSTLNVFSKGSIKNWLTDLINDDVDSTEFELFLIGQCDNPANTFITSLDKFQRNKMDKKAEVSLNGFDTNILKDRLVSFKVIPFDVDLLQKIVRDSLLQYISKRKQMMSFEQIRFIAAATTNDQMISSTKGKGIKRRTFDEELEKRILLVGDKYNPKRASIGIISFTRGTVNLEDKTMQLSLVDMFDGRRLKAEYDWNKDIYERLKNFLLTSTCNKQAYQIFLDTHTSMAFAAGRILDSKSGINIFPIQKTATNGTTLWDVKLSLKKNYSNWIISHEIVAEDLFDSALILNITHPIYKDVIRYIKESNLSIGRVINCTPSEMGATNFSIEDGNHAATLASSIYEAIGQRNFEERRSTLHIFASAPNAFMFYLGQSSLGFGKCVMYEYDFEQRNTCTYSQSIDFTK